MGDEIIPKQKESIATVTFNRPSQRNAISYHGWLELQCVAMDLEHNNDVKISVFTGTDDKAFSTGAYHQWLRLVPQQL